MLALYIACIGLPVLYLMSMLTQYGWIMPVSPNAPNRPEVPAALVTALWIASLVYSLFNGLMYGTRSAIMMDVTNPRVAATQFTAYMALMNLTISYSAAWQGIAAEAWGYPRTMLVDVIFGMICIAAIPFMARKAGEAFADNAAPARARAVAAVLGLMCLAWLPYRIWHEAFGAAQPIAGTVFTLVFIASALFLLAGRAVLGDAAPCAYADRRVAGAAAVRDVCPLFHRRNRRLVLVPDARRAYSRTASKSRCAESLWRAGVVLLLLALRPWRELSPQPAGAPAS